MSAPRRSALVDLIRDAARLDRTQSDPAVAARNALGVAAPLAIGALAGNAALGLASTVGALQVAFADRPGPYRLRMLRTTACAVTAAVTSGLAIAASRSDLGSVLLLLVLGFVAGLLVTAGPSAAQLGVAGTASALVLGHTPQPAGHALHVAALVALGGAGQVVLAIAAWPLRRHLPERRALGGLYRALADLARQPPGTRVNPPLGDQLVEVRRLLYGLGHDHGPSVEAYRVLLDEGERIRRELLVLAGLAERLDGAARPEAGVLRDVLSASAGVLDEIGAALDAARPIDPSVLEPLRRCSAEAQARLGASADLTARAGLARLPSLAGQLRAALDTARTGASEGRRGEERVEVRGIARLRDPLATLRANLTPDSSVLRHAVRLGVLVAASDLVVRLAAVERGYWLPLTILVVLRPDFAATLQRSSMRVVGTIVGLLVASALVDLVPGGQWWRIVLVAGFFFGMRLAGPGNLGLSAVAIAALVVVLLSLAGVPPHATVWPRAVDTLIGGAVALVATLFAPVWARELVPQRVAELLATYRDLVTMIADPATDGRRLQQRRIAARLARSNAQAAVDRARADPVSAGRMVELGEAVLAHSHRFVHAMLTVDALRRLLPEVPEVGEFLGSAAEVLRRCEQAIRDGEPPAPPSLRPQQEQVAQLLTARPQRVGGIDTADALVEATDRIASSLDTLVDELRRQLAAAPVAG